MSTHKLLLLLLKILRFNKFSFIFILLYKSLCIRSTPSNSSNDYSFLIKILTTCYSDQKTVVLSDTLDSNLAQSLSEATSTSIILHDTSTIVSFNKTRPNKVNFFILSFESNEKFENKLLSLKDTTWWNIMATFIILDRSDKACANARNVLEQAWERNILTCIFLCVNSEKRWMMFTFNPYTNRAPEPWRQVMINDQQDNRWTLYNRLYSNKVDCCNNLHFDRTRHLDNLKVSTSSAIFYSDSLLVKPNYDSAQLKSADYTNILIPRTFEKSLNVNFSIYFFEFNPQCPQGIYQGLNEGLYDISFSLIPMHTTGSYLILYPMTSYTTTSMMQNRGYYTSIEKIAQFYGNLTVISMVSVLSIVLFVFILSQKKRGYAFAIFETLRLLVNTSLHSQINILPLRIFFFVIFIYFLIMHATFSGNLSSFLTKEERRPTPEKMKDLENSYVKRIYVPEGISFDYTHPTIEDKVVFMDDYDCLTPVLNDTGNICLNNRPDLLAVSVKHKNLYVSEKPLASDYYSFPVRNDWPLKNRMDVALMQVADFGFASDFWPRKYLEDLENNIKRINERSLIKCRPILLYDIKFSIVILTFGYTLAIISFILEIIIAKKRNKSKTIKINRIN